MVLLYPAAARVFRTEEHQYRRFELRDFMLAERFARQTARQNAIQFVIARFSEQHHVQRVVGNFTAVSGKVIQTLSQRALQIGKTANLGIGDFAKLAHVIVKSGLLDVERFIRTPARQYLDIKSTIFGDRSMMLQ